MKNEVNTQKSFSSLYNNNRLLSQRINKYYTYLSGKSVTEEMEDTYDLKKKFYSVEVKCGHVGCNKYALVNFAVCAYNGVEAAEKARMIPRVKHDHKDAVRNVKRISEEEFKSLRMENDTNPYLKVQSVQEQRKWCSDGLKIYYEDRVTNLEKEKCWDKQYTRKDRLAFERRKEKAKRESYRRDDLAC